MFLYNREGERGIRLNRFFEHAIKRIPNCHEHFKYIYYLFGRSHSLGSWKTTLPVSAWVSVYLLTVLVWSPEQTGTPSIMSGTSFFSCFWHIRSLPCSLFALFVVGSEDVRHFTKIKITITPLQSIQSPQFLTTMNDCIRSNL